MWKAISICFLGRLLPPLFADSDSPAVVVPRGERLRSSGLLGLGLLICPQASC